jgi:hypothetical protein
LKVYRTLVYVHGFRRRRVFLLDVFSKKKNLLRCAGQASSPKPEKIEKLSAGLFIIRVGQKEKNRYHFLGSFFEVRFFACGSLSLDSK